MNATAQNAGGTIELPVELQRELRELEARAQQLTYYDLLGIAVDADGGALRRAYFERSKRLHPDAWYRRNTGEFAPLLTKWFQRLSHAYQTLADEETRSAYDREVRLRLPVAEQKALERRELSRAEVERRERERRERLLRTKGFARLGAARKLYEEALELAANGERTNAIAALMAARELDPRRREIATKLVELEREQALARGRAALTAARDREDKGQDAQAIAAYAQAFQNDPKLFEAALGAARCATRSGDPQAASTWAARAAELNAVDPQARFLLAQAFARLGLKSRARAELTLLLHHHPEHTEGRALLRTL